MTTATDRQCAFAAIADLHPCPHRAALGLLVCRVDLAWLFDYDQGPMDKSGLERDGKLSVIKKHS